MREPPKQLETRSSRRQARDRASLRDPHRTVFGHHHAQTVVALQAASRIEALPFAVLEAKHLRVEVGGQGPDRAVRALGESDDPGGVVIRRFTIRSTCGRSAKKAQHPARTSDGKAADDATAWIITFAEGA